MTVHKYNSTIGAWWWIDILRIRTSARVRGQFARANSEHVPPCQVNDDVTHNLRRGDYLLSAERNDSRAARNIDPGRKYRGTARNDILRQAS